MNLGLVLLTYVYNQQRLEWAKRSFKSLLQTKTNIKPFLQLTYKPGVEGLTGLYYELGVVFELTVNTDEEFGTGGIDNTFVVSANKLFSDHCDITHVFLLTDDFVYNPAWYDELCWLILRHPDALACTVYKSANSVHHKILADVDGDMKVSSISGTGAISRKEWEDYRPLAYSNFFVPPTEGGGSTLDLHHAWVRKGDRWATNKDYMNHIGTVGINCREGTPEYALEFVGE